MKKVLFVVFYLIPLIITYITSYMGSVSLVNAKFNPNFMKFFMIHASCYIVMIISCLKFTKDKKICIFPIIAAAFDFIPIINFIPLIPTILNLSGIIIGTINIGQNIHVEGGSTAIIGDHNTGNQLNTNSSGNTNNEKKP